MKAAVWHGKNCIRVEEIDRPEVGKGEVLFKTKVCAICATDLKAVRKGHEILKPPAVLGHEVTGEIVEVGEGITHLQEGDKVVPAAYWPCGTCFWCLRGRYTLCDKLFDENISGGFAEYVKIPSHIAKKGTFKLSNVGLEEASLTEPLACVLKNLRKCDLKSGENVFIVGAGPMGLMHVLLCRVLNADTIIASEIKKERREIARKAGADEVINPLKNSVKEVVDSYTCSRGSDVTVVTVPKKNALIQGFEAARKGGIVSMFAGVPPGMSKMMVDLNKIHYSEVELVGSFGFDPLSFKQTHKLLENGQIKPGLLITHKIGLEEIMKGFKLVENLEGLKVLVCF